MVDFSLNHHIIKLEEVRRIKDAVQWINTKVEETAMHGLEEIGDYILEKFFNNDPDEARSYNPGKHHSFTKLAKHPDLMIHRTTIQNAVGITLLKRNNEFRALTSLKKSHLIALLPLHRKYPEKLVNVARKADHEQWTVKRTRLEVLKLKKKHIPLEQKLVRDVQSIKRKFDRIIDEITASNPNSRQQLLTELESCIDFLQKKKTQLSEPVLHHTGSLN